MIVEVMMRVRVDDELGLVDVGTLVGMYMEPLDHKVVGLVQKFDLPGRPPEQRKLAMDWLRLCLSNGPAPAGEVFDKGALSGIASKTLRRAADDLGVVRRPPGGGRKCVWSLPKRMKGAS